MHPLFLNLIKDFKIGSDLRENVTTFLIRHNRPNTAKHCQDVGDIAAELATRFDVDKNAAQKAGWLHDISRVFPNDDWIKNSKALGLDIIPVEEAYPVLLHQKLSVALAKEIFIIEEEEILSAIGCHTTLKAEASPLDQVVYMADKLGWRRGPPRPVEKYEKALEVSLNEAVWVFQDDLLHSGKIENPHPWMQESYFELSRKLSKP